MEKLVASKHKSGGVAVPRLNRLQIRNIAHAHVTQCVKYLNRRIPFPVLLYLEYLGRREDSSDYEIVEDIDLPLHDACYEPETNQILIGESTYDAAHDPTHPNFLEALFTIAHEIGHWALGHREETHGYSVEELDVVALPGHNSEEQADIFAEELLLCTLMMSRRYDTSEKISTAFRVSPVRAKKRIRDLGKENFWKTLPEVS